MRVPLEEQAQVDQLIVSCLDLHLDSQRTDICQAWARKLEGSNQVGLALTYFEKGQGVSDIERICWDHFERLLLTSKCCLRPLLTFVSGGNTSQMDPKLIELLQSPPQSPMTGTLIAPLALLLAFFELKDNGDTGAAVQHLSKLFRLSSMPREYIALLMAEMLPILDGNYLSNPLLNGQRSGRQSLDRRIYSKFSLPSRIMLQMRALFRKDPTYCRGPPTRKVLMRAILRLKTGEQWSLLAPPLAKFCLFSE